MGAIFMTASMNIAKTGSADTSENIIMLDQIAEFTAAGPNGARLSLTAVTDFDWDTVRGFSSGMPLSRYQRFLGEAFTLDDTIKSQLTDNSSLLIFLKDGQVVRQVVIGPPIFMTEMHGEAWDRTNAIMAIHTKDPGPYSSIRMVR